MTSTGIAAVLESALEEITALALQTAIASSAEDAESGESAAEVGRGPKDVSASPTAERLTKAVFIATKIITVPDGRVETESVTIATVGTSMAEISISIAEKRDAKAKAKRGTGNNAKDVSVLDSVVVSSCNAGRLKIFRSQNSISS